MKALGFTQTEYVVFAHGGAGYCISRGLANSMAPFAANGSFSNLQHKYINEMEDVVMGYLVRNLLHYNLLESKLFNSHYHQSDLQNMPIEELPKQVTLSYSMRDNVRVNISEFSPGVKAAFGLDEDPTRFLTIHCYIFPESCPKYID